MAKRVNSAGWIITAGAAYETYPDILPAVHTVTEAHRRWISPDWSCTHTCWVLDCHFEVNSKVRGDAPGATWQVREPDTLHLYPPGCTFSIDTSAVKGPLHAVWTRFGGGEKLGLMRLVDPSQNFGRIHDPTRVVIKQLRDMARLAQDRGVNGYMAVMSAFFRIVDCLLQAQENPDGSFTLAGGAPAVIHDNLIESVKTYLTQNLGRNITLQKLASHVHASVPTIERRYSAAMGESIMQTLIRMRLDRVKELLIAGHGVKDAADQSGFWDASHLSKTFKKHEGVSPRQYIQHMTRRIR